MTAAIQAVNLVKTYGPVRALAGVNVTVQQGEVVGYLGPNGSGKSTTIAALTGVLTLDSGEARVLDEVPGRSNALLGRVGVVSDVNGLYERLSALKNLRFFARAIGAYSGDAELRDWLDRFDLADRANCPVGQYSKGMKRRLAVARALLGRPEVLFLDEPFDGIDIESRARIIEMLREANRTRTTTILLTSHVMADIEDLASRIVIIKSGRILIDESLDAFQDHSASSLTDIYLSVVKL